MRSVFILAFVIAVVAAEPPRRRFNFRTFARQEVEENGSGSGTEQPQGYDYSPPAEANQLKLPARFQFTKFARQEEEERPTYAGYNYPKPTYGPPATEEPATEYGTPATTDEPSTEESTDDPAPIPDSEVERLRGVQASQLRLRSGKFAKPQKLVRAKFAQQQQQQLVQVQQQPIIYVDYPIASDLVEPQYVYIFK